MKFTSTQHRRRTIGAGMMALIGTIFATGARAGAARAAGRDEHACHDAELTARNRRIVQDFAELFYRQRKVRQAFETYVGDSYIQHNPSLPDGREAAISLLEPMFSRAGSSYDIKRILVDGELAAIHLHGRSSPEQPGGAVVDLFRLRHGKIVEHWDVLQPVPATAANTHPMF